MRVTSLVIVSPREKSHYEEEDEASSVVTCNHFIVIGCAVSIFIIFLSLVWKKRSVKILESNKIYFKKLQKDTDRLPEKALFLNTENKTLILSETDGENSRKISNIFNPSENAELSSAHNNYSFGRPKRHEDIDRSLIEHINLDLNMKEEALSTRLFTESENEMKSTFQLKKIFESNLNKANSSYSEIKPKINLSAQKSLLDSNNSHDLKIENINNPITLNRNSIGSFNSELLAKIDEKMKIQVKTSDVSMAQFSENQNFLQNSEIENQLETISPYSSQDIENFDEQLFSDDSKSLIKSSSDESFNQERLISELDEGFKVFNKQNYKLCNNENEWWSDDRYSSVPDSYSSLPSNSAKITEDSLRKDFNYLETKEYHISTEARIDSKSAEIESLGKNLSPKSKKDFILKNVSKKLKRKRSRSPKYFRRVTSYSSKLKNTKIFSTKTTRLRSQFIRKKYFPKSNSKKNTLESLNSVLEI